MTRTVALLLAWSASASLVTKAGDRIDVGECRDGSPATDDMVRAGVRWRNVDGSASSARLRKLRDALAARRSVSIAVVGGSPRDLEFSRESGWPRQRKGRGCGKCGDQHECSGMHRCGRFDVSCCGHC